MFQRIKNEISVEMAGVGIIDPTRIGDLHEIYPRLNPSERSRLEKEFSLLLHDIRMAGVWKRTNPDRLRQTERAILDYLDHKSRKSLEVLDIGASDGITTLELVDFLEKNTECRVNGIASDLNIELIEFSNGLVREYRAENGEAILAICGSIGIRLARNASNTNLGPLEWMYLKLDYLRSKFKRTRVIPLISPKVLADGRLKAIKSNCLQFDESLASSCDVIRASNVLNLDYFSEDQLRTAIRNLKRYLRKGGLLVVSRNVGEISEEVEHGTVWCLQDNEILDLKVDFGLGSEIKHVVEALRGET